MYEIEKVFENTAFVINFIVQLLLLIVFLKMAWNIAKVRKFLMRDSHSLLLDEARRLEFKEKYEDAIDVYLDYIYAIKISDMVNETKEEKLSIGVKAIKKLGGKIPEGLEKYLN